MAPRLRRLTRADVPALLAIQHDRAGTAGRRSAASLAAELFDSARGHGDHVDVAVDGAEVRGAVGRVLGGEAGFLAPVIAADLPTAEHLIAVGVAALLADGARTIRASTGELDGPVARALAAAGFAQVFELVDLVRASAPGAELPGPAIRPLAAVVPAAIRALHDRSIGGTPNALPLTDDDLAAARDGPTAFAPGSGVAVAADGAPVGLLFAASDRDERGAFATVEMVAVDPDHRRGGLARALIRRLLGAAHAHGLDEVRALVASTNVASLAAHRALGFVDLYRRTVFERVT